MGSSACRWTWQPSTRISTTPKVTAVVDNAGNAQVAWERSGFQGDLQVEDYWVYARALDGPPGLADIAVPATGTTGSPVTMSASATADWSGPASITWDFGDGGTGAGGSVSHVYAAAGSYVVRVTATDAAGNTAALTLTIAIGPAPLPGPPAAGDSTAPVLSGARLKPKVLAPGHGAKLRVTSSEAASLKAAVQRKKNRKWRSVGSKTWTVRAGTNTTDPVPARAR